MANLVWANQFQVVERSLSEQNIVEEGDNQDDDEDGECDHVVSIGESEVGHPAIGEEEEVLLEPNAFIMGSHQSSDHDDGNEEVANPPHDEERREVDVFIEHEVVEGKEDADRVHDPFRESHLGNY